MNSVTTQYGDIPVAGYVEWHPNGQIMSCAPAAEVALATKVGPLVPQYTTDDLRRRTVQSVQFHENGRLRNLPLERPTLIETSVGQFLAELVTFHPDGSLSRIFPLNGKLSGYWTQEDEGRLAKPLTFSSPIGPITARIIGLSFDPGGRLRSITLWPGEVVQVPTPVGVLAARVGISFRADGSVRCLEPAKPQTVMTPVGKVNAYDLDTVGISGDINSLAFATDGSIARVSTSLTSVRVTYPDGTQDIFSPASRESLCGDTDVEPVPMILEFSPSVVSIRQHPLKPGTLLSLTDTTFRTEPYLKSFAHPFGKMACTG